MKGYWTILAIIVLLVSLCIYFCPKEVQGMTIHKGWLYLENFLLASTSVLVRLYEKYLVTGEDSYARLQSIYISSFAKFLVVGGVAVAYVIMDKSSFTKITLLIMMLIYVIYLIFMTITSVRNSSNL